MSFPTNSEQTVEAVRDRLNRPLRDLRISVTDRCNFRCPYCMPAEIFGEKYEFLAKDKILTFEEIARLTRIIIPLLVPTIAYFVLINVIWIFVGLFGLVFTVTEGGPGYATTPFDLMIYRKAFEAGEMGYASALSVILFLIVLVISAFQLRTFDRLTTDV